MRRLSNGTGVLSAACAFAVMLIACAAAPAQSRITAENLTDEHVRLAIDTIVEALYERKDLETFWDPPRLPKSDSQRQEGGYTALVTLALLYAGENYQDPRLRDAIEHLAKFESMRGTYAISVRAAVWARLPERFNRQLGADAKWLVDGFSPKIGGWDYVQNPNVGRYDNSLRQFGALALWEAAKRGGTINPRLWARMEDHLLSVQLPDGGWNYTTGRETTGSMTAAGLATLYITQELLHADPQGDAAEGAAQRNREAIERGLSWMNRWYRPDQNPGSQRDFYYYAYALERVGLAGGRKYFAGRDWFRETAAEIIDRLLEWDADEQTFRLGSQGNRLYATSLRYLSFGLMFLSRGRVPIAVNKLEIPDYAWNNRPRDVANLVRWIVDATETELNWQIASFEAEPEQWLDAPLLYLSSDEPLPWLADVEVDAEALKRDVREFLRKRAAGEIPMDADPPAIPTSPELRKLKRYLDLGGLLIASSESRSRRFADSIERIGQLIYPQYDWRRLPPDHAAYALHDRVTRRKPVLMALSNGVRELIILSTGADLSEAYQTNETKRSRGYFETAANLYFYKSEMNRPRPRLEPHTFKPARAARTTKSITIVRAVHEGNWKPEPRALDVFEAYLASEHEIGVRILDRPLHEIHEIEPHPELVIVSGVERHEFTPRQKDAIERFIDSTPRGVILFETPGGVGDFTESAERIGAELFEEPIRSLTRETIITGDGLPDALDLTRISYRPFTIELLGTRETTPRLRGIPVDGRMRLLFSREDLSHGLLDQPCWGINGYAPESARELLANIALYAMRAAPGE